MSDERPLAYFTRALPPVMAVAAIGFALNALIFITMARLLDPGSFGDLKVAASTMLVASLAVGLGGSRAAGKFLPERIAGVPSAIAYLKFYTLVIVGLSLIVGVAIWVITWICFGVFPRDIHGHHPASFVVLLVPVWAGLDLLSQTFMATRRPVLAALPARFVFPVVGLAMIYAAHWAGWHLSDVMFVVVLSGAGLATLAVFTGYLVVLEQAPIDQPSRRESASPGPRVWLALSLPMVGAGLIVVLAAELPLFALALFGKNGDAGLYGAAATLTQAFVIIITCQRQIYGPALAGALKQGPKAARRLHAHAQVQAAIFALPLLALMLLAADPLLGLFGPGFADGRHVLWVIATGLAIHTLTALSPRWLDYGGHARLVLITEGVAAGALIVGLVAVTPMFGMIGAATVFAVVVAARSLFLAVAASRWLGLPLVRLGAVDP